jgi:hypothetical protein
VRVLRLVEEPIDQAHRVEAEVLADRRRVEPRALEDLRCVQRTARDDDGVGRDPLSAGFDAHGTAVLDEHPVDRCLCPHLEQPARPCIGDPGVPGRLAGVRRTALEAGAAVHAVPVRVGHDRLERVAERLHPALDRMHARLPVRPLADPEPLLDAHVVRLEIRRQEGPHAVRGQAALAVPLGHVLLVRAQGDLRIDGGRPADAAAGEERDHVAVRKGPEPERPPEGVIRLRLPAVEIDRGQVWTGLE